MDYFLVDIKKIFIVSLLVAFIGVVLILFYQYNPVESSFFLPCPFHYLTGLHCPGCGSQRALHQLAHLNILGAFQYNPLLVLSLPLVVYGLGTTVYNYLYHTKYRVALFYNNRFVYTFFGIILLFWILRNIPIEPFTSLAPMNS